jgi:hypothetical protein
MKARLREIISNHGPTGPDYNLVTPHANYSGKVQHQQDILFFH